MPAVSEARTVLVTGATGFLASRLIQHLLIGGYHVRGSVRSLARHQDVMPLRALEGASTDLALFEADLLQPNAFDEAVAECEVVFHTASPYRLVVKDPQRDLVDPAVRGTLNVLEACSRTASVRRVVLTSSMVAVTDEPERDRVLTEADWNTKSTLRRNPYHYAKTSAERAAWRFMDEGARNFDLVAINPFMVIGPSLVPRINTSNQVLVDLANGTFPAIIDLHWGIVDVRDVADAHVRAMETPGAHGRYICAAETVSMREIVTMLAAHGWGARFRLPRTPLDSRVGNAIVRLESYRRPAGVGVYLRTHVGRPPRFDNAKIRRELGLTFRPVATTVLETFADLARWGHLPE